MVESLDMIQCKSRSTILAVMVTSINSVGLLRLFLLPFPLLLMLRCCCCSLVAAAAAALC